MHITLISYSCIVLTILQERYERHVQFQHKKASKAIAGVKKVASAAIADAKDTIKHKDRVIAVSSLLLCLFLLKHLLIFYCYSSAAIK